jgi:RHS repeat-associated protein
VRGDGQTKENPAPGFALATRHCPTDEPLEIRQQSVPLYYHADGLGSITELTKSNGSAVNTYTYAAFGGDSPANTETVANSFHFTAREYDPETKLYYYRARYYDPLWGRFLSEDPCRSEVGVSLYSYVDSSPVNYLDQDGCRRKKKQNRASNPTPQQMKMLEDGMDTALHALNGKDCRALFCGHGADPVERLKRTKYYFFDLGDETVGAETPPGGDMDMVLINSKGLFVTANSGIVTFGKARYDLGMNSNVRAMILLHELGHQLGIFPPDAGKSLQDQRNAHSIDVVKHCFPLYTVPIH